MSLPSLFEPAGLPVFLAADHGIDPEDLYSTQQRGTGHRRKRRVFTTAFRRVSVGRVLTPAQVEAYDDWFENTIIVGETHFSAEIANLGPGQLWFECCWSAPYQVDPVATPQGIYWRLSGELILFGEGVESQPVDGALDAVEFVVRLRGSAHIVVPAELSVEYDAALLLGGVALSAEYDVALEVAEPFEFPFLLIDADSRLLIDGSHYLRIG